jgi:biopolymer transport protein ExbD
MNITDQNGEKYRIMAEINMVPLIDVALVLLIIFMVMTPILVKSQIKINLPPVGSAPETTPTQTLTILVDKSGKLYIGDRMVTDESLPADLKRLVRNPATQPVIIEADKGVQFEHVITVMDIVKQLGILKINIGVKPTGKADRKSAARNS